MNVLLLYHLLLSVALITSSLVFSSAVWCLLVHVEIKLLCRHLPLWKINIP